MPILSRIERRGFKARALVAALYGLLIVGAVTMVYPFLLMISGSTMSDVDSTATRVIPAYLTDQRALWNKFSEGMFNESLEEMRSVTSIDVPQFKSLLLPGEVNTDFVDQWEDFLRIEPSPPYAFVLGHMATPTSRSEPLLFRQFKVNLRSQFGSSIADINRALGTEFPNWNAFNIQQSTFTTRRDKFVQTPIIDQLNDFAVAQSPGDRYYTSVEGWYVRVYLRSQYSRTIENYNQTHDTSFRSFDQVHLSRSVPPESTPRQREDWISAVRFLLHPFWLRIDASANGAYRSFLQAKYASDIHALNRVYESQFSDFDEIPLPSPTDLMTATGIAYADLDVFLQGWIDPQTNQKHIAPIDALSISSTEFRFRDWLMAKFGSIDQLNAALGTSFTDVMDILPPQEGFLYRQFEQRTGFWKWEYTARNYIAVLDYIVLRGRGMINTVIYCVLAVLSALIVNPLAAYALSRYKPSNTYKILLFLMLTMAFPPMVAQIPSFLMLRQFNMLNTFWALILPGLANGYSIFLLKGFFDSLPQELYESAALDGAGELRVFWQITLSLSKPILAVIALNAFTHAYSNFMFALLICQDRNMWTLMVWLYVLQQNAGKGVIYASLLIAAIPTFLIFAFCQNIIMRGIVVPVEK